MTSHALAHTWSSVISSLAELGPDAKLRILAEHIDHPMDFGMMQIETGPNNEYFDYGYRIRPGLWCFARQYADAYVVRLIELSPQDIVSARQRTPALTATQQPKASIFEKVAESPGWALGLTAVLGAGAGALGGGAKGAAAGAAVGSLIGLAAIAVSSAGSSPATAQAAQTLFLGLSTAALAGQASRRPAAISSPQRFALPSAQEPSKPASGRRSSTKK